MRRRAQRASAGRRGAAVAAARERSKHLGRRARQPSRVWPDAPRSTRLPRRLRPRRSACAASGSGRAAVESTRRVRKQSASKVFRATKLPLVRSDATHARARGAPPSHPSPPSRLFHALAACTPSEGLPRLGSSTPHAVRRRAARRACMGSVASRGSASANPRAVPALLERHAELLSRFAGEEAVPVGDPFWCAAVRTLCASAPAHAARRPGLSSWRSPTCSHGSDRRTWSST